MATAACSVSRWRILPSHVMMARSLLSMVILTSSEDMKKNIAIYLGMALILTLLTAESEKVGVLVFVLVNLAVAIALAQTYGVIDYLNKMDV